MTDGKLLANVPIIDLRGTSNNEIHTDFHSYELRARLDKANGNHENHVIWTAPRRSPATRPGTAAAPSARGTCPARRTARCS